MPCGRANRAALPAGSPASRLWPGYCLSDAGRTPWEMAGRTASGRARDFENGGGPVGMMTAIARMRTLTAAVGSACALVALAGPTTAQTRYSITELDALSCAPTALNDLGAVVGDCGSGGTLDSTAFLWQNGVVTSLGKLRRANYSAAHAINDAGVAVGEGDTGDFRP